MARVSYVEVNTTTNPDIIESFQRMIQKRGKVTNIYKALAHKPDILKTIGPFVAAVQKPDEIDANLKERIILRVSRINRSAYCCHAHKQISSKLGFTDEQIEEILDDPDSANISESDRAALKYAEHLTLSPGDIPDSIYNELASHFSESQIVEITAVAALYNMINRFNEALKLDLEDY
ncbi:MAG: peroxidase-related enzyme [Candidatus Dadabacteria bacterium]|nr:peroxidase-related enzyme [Candidatus Dadabacteria bacterium]